MTREMRSDGERPSPLAMVAKKHYTVRQTYWITHDAARTIRHFAHLRSRSARFTERIMPVSYTHLTLPTNREV